MKKILALAFLLCTQWVYAQTKEEFLEKLQAIDISDSKARLAMLDKALAKFPKDAELYAQRADLKTTLEAPFSNKDTQGFIADYTKAIEFDNVSWRYTARANGKVLIKDYKGALADCNTAISMAEKVGEKEHIFSAYHQRSNVFAFLKDYKNAINDLEKALQNSEENSFAAGMLSSAADYAKEMKDMELALRYTDRAIALYHQLKDNTEATMFYSRGMLKLEMPSKKSEACADFRKALALFDKESTGLIEMVQDAIKTNCK